MINFDLILNQSPKTDFSITGGRRIFVFVLIRHRDQFDIIYCLAISMNQTLTISKFVHFCNVFFSWYKIGMNKKLFDSFQII